MKSYYGNKAIINKPTNLSEVSGAQFPHHRDLRLGNLVLVPEHTVHQWTVTDGYQATRSICRDINHGPGREFKTEKMRNMQKKEKCQIRRMMEKEKK